MVRYSVYILVQTSLTESFCDMDTRHRIRTFQEDLRVPTTFPGIVEHCVLYLKAVNKRTNPDKLTLIQPCAILVTKVSGLIYLLNMTAYIS